MANEIERKYLVTSNEYISLAVDQKHIRQGYLSSRKEATVRIRISNDAAYVTVKGKNRGIERKEWEYRIPKADAEQMIELHEGIVIEKIRYIVPWQGKRWEIDEFKGKYEGLIVAEIELSSADEPFEIPPFIGREVSGDPRYYNSVMAGL